MGGCSFSIHNIAYRLQGFKILMLKTYVALLHCRLEIVLEVVRLQLLPAVWRPPYIKKHSRKPFISHLICLPPVFLLHGKLVGILGTVRLQCSSGNPPVASSHCMASAIY